MIYSEYYSGEPVKVISISVTLALCDRLHGSVAVKLETGTITI